MDVGAIFCNVIHVKPSRGRDRGARRRVRGRKERKQEKGKNEMIIGLLNKVYGS